MYMGPNIWLRGRNWPSFGPLAFRPFGTADRVPHAVVIKHTFTLSHFHIFKLSHFSHWTNPVLRNRERSTMRGKWEDFCDGFAQFTIHIVLLIIINHVRNAKTVIISNNIMIIIKLWIIVCFGLGFLLWNGCHNYWHQNSLCHRC